MNIVSHFIILSERRKILELKTIGEVSKDLGISTRMLRYYEKEGLITSSKKEGYAYRVYDSKAVSRLYQIVFLRKLRFSLKQISILLSSSDAHSIIEIFRENTSGLTDEINALSVIRMILNNIVKELKKSSDSELRNIMLSNKFSNAAARLLTSKKNELKEEKLMDELNNAGKELSKLRDVRIIYLPPFTAASSHYIGENPEEEAEKPLTEFIKNSNLGEIKPDARVFGFNNPNPSPENAHYGYEFWVTVPEDIEVTEPLKKKKFSGGLYAVHTINFGDFHEWKWLLNWVKESTKYTEDYRDETEECMCGLLEEALNFVYRVSNNINTEKSEHQMDLFFPVKLK